MAKDWTKIQQKYNGKWVALADDEETVVGSGDTVRAALNEAKKNGNADPILTRMPEALTTYIGSW